MATTPATPKAALRPKARPREDFFCGGGVGCADAVGDAVEGCAVVGVARERKRERRRMDWAVVVEGMMIVGRTKDAVYCDAMCCDAMRYGVPNHLGDECDVSID